MALSEIVFILGHHLGQAPGALFLKFKAIPGRTSVQSCVDFRFYPFLWVFFFSVLIINANNIHSGCRSSTARHVYLHPFLIHYQLRGNHNIS